MGTRVEGRSSIDIFILHDDEKIDVNQVVDISEVDTGIIVIESTNQSLYSRKFNDNLVIMKINNNKIFAKIEGVRFRGIEDIRPHFEIVCNRNRINKEQEAILNMLY